MRDITTNWNNSAYANETVFVDFKTGNTVTIPAGKPVDVRAMYDSVSSGAYFVNPTSVTVDPDVLATAPEDEDTVTVTVEGGVTSALVFAASEDTDIATVSPASAAVASDGTVTFTITSVAAGEVDVTFTCGTRTDTATVTVTDPD
jgi:hypothetical protein